MNSVSLADIQDEARKTAMEWWSTSDVLAKEIVYTTKEQYHNDHLLMRLITVGAKALTSGYVKNYEKFAHNSRMTGKVAGYIGKGVTWFVLRTWSQVFLSKSHQRLGHSGKWFETLALVESIIKHFNSWTSKTYPTCSIQERMKAMRLLYIAIFLGAVYGQNEMINYEGIFSFALLYPLIDDFLDIEPDRVLCRDFVLLLKDYISVPETILTEFKSPHPNSKLVGELHKVVHPFRLSPGNYEIALTIMNYLVDLESKKNPGDVLFAAACKGGFTLCILHLLVKGTLLRSDLSMLVRLGFAVQIVDDLQDLEEDVAEQNITLATSSAYVSHDLRRQFARKLSFEDGLRKVLTESLTLLCMESASSSSSLRQEDRLLIVQHSAVSADFLKKHPIEGSLHKLISFLG